MESNGNSPLFNKINPANRIVNKYLIAGEIFKRFFNV